MGQDAESSKIKVSDRRRFSADGEPLQADQQPQEKDEEPSPEPQAKQPQAPPAGAPTTEAFSPPPGEGPPLPPASFDMLVLSLGMQAQMELGPGDAPQGPPPNLDLARHTIDLLGILQEKTKGNLSLDESRLLENTLTELRFRYVQAVSQINKKAKT